MACGGGHPGSIFVASEFCIFCKYLLSFQTQILFSRPCPLDGISSANFIKYHQVFLILISRIITSFARAQQKHREGPEASAQHMNAKFNAFAGPTEGWM